MDTTTTQSASIAPLRSYEENNSRRTVNNELGKDEFLQLLAAQLQFQDPLEPAKDTEFIAQLAQFSSLQQMQSMTSFQYFSLAGKYVAANATLDSGIRDTIFGPVDFVHMKDGTPYAQIGDYLVKATDIIEVYDTDILSGNDKLLEAAALIGCTVKAKIADGEEIAEVSGIVNRVAVENQTLVAYLEEHEIGIPISNIFDIQKDNNPAVPNEEIEQNDINGGTTL